MAAQMSRTVEAAVPLRLWVVTIYGGLSENGLCFMCFVCVCGFNGMGWGAVGHCGRHM